MDTGTLHPGTLLRRKIEARRGLVVPGSTPPSRAVVYAEAGADVTFVEAPESVEALRRIPREIGCPQVVNVVIGGRTPTLAAAELAAMRGR